MKMRSRADRRCGAVATYVLERPKTETIRTHTLLYMEHSLIANSGIQVQVQPVCLDLNARVQTLFREWFDENEVQTNLEFVYQLRESEKVVRVSDLESCLFLDADSRLTVSEEEVLANPNIEVLYEGDVTDADEIFSLRLNDPRHCMLEKYLNQWLPLPYYEVDSMGNFKEGPYNWARCKLMPAPADGSQADGKLKLTAVFAFDTHALYDEPDDYAECPSFVSPSEHEKHFRLCGRPLGMIDFCSNHNVWVRSYLLNLAHGTTDIDSLRLGEGEHKYQFLATYLLLVNQLASQVDMPEIRLLRDRDVNCIDVEMIVDIGNSRTAAVLFEGGDFTKVKPLHLQNFTQLLTPDGQLNRTEQSFDMRVAFQKVNFGRDTMYGSSQFIWPSVVRLGTEAEQLMHQTVSLAEGDEILSTYSSPKRYLWDVRPRREEWRCVRTNRQGRNEEPVIEGMSNYLRDDGSVDEEGFGVGLHYSRRSLMTLAFMEIVLQARAQINSEEHRLFHGRMSTPRRLDKVVLTCPTAMSESEQRALHECLENALRVLDLFATSTIGCEPYDKISIVPELKRSPLEDRRQWIFDEATCSQFVYLYGLFSDTYLNCSEEFFKIYGRKRPAEEGEAPHESVVIGSLDIGAGTTDLMVCRYQYDAANPARLCPQPVYFDTFNQAGDDMMKVLIENVLLQGKYGILEKELSRRGLDEERIRRLLYQFFGTDNNNLSFAERMMRRDFNLQVLVPLISHFLDLLAHGESYRDVTYSEVFAHNAPSSTVLDCFSQKFGFSLKEITWTYDAHALTLNIERCMNELLETVATLMYAHDCDVVILSGRPSSLSPIRNIFLKYWGGQPDRLVVLNKHRIGRWYPFADEFGYLTNSKSIVPVGAMIGYLASTAGGMNGFSLDLSVLAKGVGPTTDYFVSKNALAQQNPCFITPTKQNGQITVNSFPSYIGTKQYDLALYPVRPFYVIDINQDRIRERLRKKFASESLTDSRLQQLMREYVDKLLSRVPLTFTIDRPDYQSDKERLEISAVMGTDGAELTPADFSLTVQSLNDPDCYWLDSGAFNINIKA